MTDIHLNLRFSRELFGGPAYLNGTVYTRRRVACYDEDCYDECDTYDHTELGNVAADTYGTALDQATNIVLSKGYSKVSEFKLVSGNQFKAEAISPLPESIPTSRLLDVLKELGIEGVESGTVSLSFGDKRATVVNGSGYTPYRIDLKG